MTGSGTQADPYVVTTMAEFISKVAEDNAYVKLGDDIYCKDDPVYKYQQTSRIEINCVDLDGDGYSIYGFNTSNSNVLIFGTNGVAITRTVHNIGFLSFVKANSQAGPTILVYSSSAAQFVNCKFSFLLKQTSSTYTETTFSGKSGGTLDFTNCSIYVKYSIPGRTSFSASNCGRFFSYCNVTNCYTVLDGPVRTINYSSADESTQTNSTLVILNVWYNYVRTGYYRFHGSNSIFYIEGQASSNNFSGSSLSIRSTGLCVCYNGIKSPDGTTYIQTDSQGSVSFISDTQIKDKNYLVSIGFIP